jgi:hypothetical protein
MASIITLDGARLGATNEYGEEIAPVQNSLWADAAKSFVGWGIVAFAVGTGVFRAAGAFRGLRRGAPVQGFFGRRRRRR